jgi:hypothetical protein
MDYTSQERVESKAMKGVFLTYIKMVEGHRLELRRRAASVSSKITPLARQIQASDKQLQLLKGSADQAQLAKLMELQLAVEQMMEQADLIHQTELEPIWVRWGLLKIEADFTIDGAAPTPENIAYGPTELYTEIVESIRERLGLSSEAIKNSSSPITLTAPGDGMTGDSTAESAATPETNSTPQETVIATSQAA